MTGRNGPGPHAPDPAALQAAAEPFTPLAGAAPRPALIQRMWWEWVKDWPSPAPHERLYLYMRLDGVTAAAAEAAVAGLIARHDTLRSRFSDVDGRLTLMLNDAADFAVQTVAVDAAGDALEAAFTAERTRFAAEPLPFDGPWLSRARIAAAPSGVLICLAFHHLVFDARSRVLVEQELRARLSPDWDEPPRPRQYVDYAAWEAAWLERSGALAAYWRDWLAAAPTLRGPGGRPLVWRPSHKVYWEFEIAGEPVERLKAIAPTSTPFRALLAAVALAVSRWAGQERVVLRTVGDLRTTRPLTDMIGNLVCTDLVVLETPAEPDAAALIEQAGAAYRSAVQLRCPNLLGLPDSPAFPDVSENGVGTKTAMTMNYMPLYKLLGTEPPAPGALGAYAPPVPTRMAQREYWPTPVCPLNLRIWDWGERLVCRMEFDDDATTEADQRRLNDLIIEAVRRLPDGIVP